MNRMQIFKGAYVSLILQVLMLVPIEAMESQDLSIEEKMSQLKIVLPEVTLPIANYVPCVRTGNLVYVSGQLPVLKGTLQVSGQLGDTTTEEEGIEGAKLCALNILAHLKNEITSLDNVVRCVKLTGFVSATPKYISHPKIINGASDLIVAIFGDKGKHARAAVGVSSLPLGAAVEVEAIFEVK